MQIFTFRKNAQDLEKDLATYSNYVMWMFAQLPTYQSKELTAQFWKEF